MSSSTLKALKELADKVKGEAMKEEFGRTVILNLVPTSFRLSINVDNDADESILLVGWVRLEHEESVKLATDEEFNKLEGVLRLIEQKSEETEDAKPIGWMTYVPEFSSDLDFHKATYQLDIRIPRRRFELLVSTVSQGRMPSGISINVQGMSYDWQPDGSGKIWDNKKCPQLPIRSLSIGAPLIGRDPRDFLDDRNEEDSMPPSRAQINELISNLQELKSALKSVPWKLTCILILVGVLFGTYLWRFG